MGNSNTIATILALVVVLWTIISMRNRYGDLSPAILHNAAWAGGLLIVGSGLLRYAPLSGYAWLLIVSSILFFNGGVAIAGAQPKHRSGKIAPIVADSSLVSRRTYRILLLSFSVGFAIYLATIAELFGLAALVLDPQSIREYSGVSYLEAFPIYGKLLFYLAPLCLILTLFPGFVAGKRSPFVLRLIVMIYLVGGMVATLQRTLLFVGLTWIVGMLVLQLNRMERDGPPTRSNRKRTVSIIVAAVVGLSTFQGIALALGKTGTENSAISSEVDPRLRNNQLTSVLHYASSGIPAFGKLADSQNEAWPPPAPDRPVYGDYNPQTWGAATLAAPLKLVPGVPHWNDISPFIYLPVPTNVYTWLEPWYRDFRWAGVIFGSLITGILIGRFARRRHDSPEAMLAATFLVGMSGLATFTNRFIAVVSLVIYVTLWVLGALRRSRETAGPKKDVASASRSHLFAPQVSKEPEPF